MIKVNEIFYSIQGETARSGFPSVFIRLTGCNLNCSYCDTEYARFNGTPMSIDSIMTEIKKYKSADHITVTGGEPLLQRKTYELLDRIIEQKMDIQLETNGSMDLQSVNPGVRKIVDVKTPSSGEKSSFLMKNLSFISQSDEIKFVISDIIDYNFTKNFINKHLADTDAVINLSPVYGTVSYKQLSDLIIKDRLRVRLNLQLHKITGGK